jgi:nitrous oxidase accessory protein NosD
MAVSKRFWSFLLLAVLCVSAARVWSEPAGRVCFVAIEGDDSNPGTEARPWRTLKKAAAEAEAGMTVVVGQGTYAERLVLRRSGTPSAPIIFMARAGDSVTIEGKGISFPDPLWNGLIDIDKQSNITISGFTVANSASTGIFVVYSDNVAIERNRTINTANSGILAWYCRNVVIDGNEVDRTCMERPSEKQEALSVAATDVFRISNNSVHDGGTEGIDAKMGSSHGTISGNRAYGEATTGIYVDAWEQHEHDIEVFDNVSHGNQHGFAVASESGGLIERISVHHNVSYDNSSGGFWVAGWNRPTPHPLKDIQVYANVSYRNRWGFIVFANADTSIEGVRLFNNLAYDNTDSGITIAGTDDLSKDFLVRDVLVINNTIHGNGTGRQWDSGGIHLYNLDARGIVIRNNIVSGNVSFSIAVEPVAPPRAVEVTIDHNLIDGYRGTGRRIAGPRPSLEIRDLWTPEAPTSTCVKGQRQSIGGRPRESRRWTWTAALGRRERESTSGRWSSNNLRQGCAQPR